MSNPLLRRSVTAKDIGRRLGLSQPTVSRILSGAQGHRVSEETRRRVLEAAAEMDYRPNAIARSLRHRRTNVVGLYAGYGFLDARNPFLAGVIGGLQRACEDHQLDLLLHGVFRGASTDDIYCELADGRIDGLFVQAGTENPLVARLRASSLPVVALADPIPGVPSVVADDAGGLQLLIEFLWKRGHRRIGFIRPASCYTSVENRCRAFEIEMLRRGVPEAHRRVFTVEMEQGGSVLEQWRQMPERPTALCCWNDLSAYDLLSACKAQGIRVPEDLAVVGFDGLHHDPRLGIRPLVTVESPWNDITRTAADLLVGQIAFLTGGGGTSSAPASLTTLPVTLMPGDTV